MKPFQDTPECRGIADDRIEQLQIEQHARWEQEGRKAQSVMAMFNKVEVAVENVEAEYEDGTRVLRKEVVETVVGDKTVSITVST